MSSSADPESSLDLFQTVAHGNSFLVSGTTRHAKDLCCIDVEQRILFRDEATAFAVLRYYRPVVLDHFPEHYPLAVADGEPDARRKRRFLVLSRGVLQLQAFPTTGHLFIPKNAWVKEPPSQSAPSWIVCADRLLAAEYERMLFGGTLQEIEVSATALERAGCGPGAIARGAAVRIAVSKKQDNQCALSGAFIPKGFPFLIFDGSASSAFGHVSLSGFYRQLAFLCRGDEEARGAFQNQILAKVVEAGGDPDVISRFCEIGRKVSGRALIHWGTLQWPVR